MARNFTHCLTLLLCFLFISQKTSAQTADAGLDQTRCGVNTATMAGNKPTGNNKGKWTYVSGTTGTFASGQDSLPGVVFTAGTATPTGTTTLRWTIEPGLVISQIYGGGGNTGATFRNDFVELHNRSSQSINLTGYSLQYASSTGTFNANVALTGTIAPGAFRLIQLASDNTTIGVALPTADQSSSSINMSASAGKIALVKQTTVANLGCGSTATVCSATQVAQIVDLVTYGTATTGIQEGTRIGNLSATQVAIRNPTATSCNDTDVNATDFTVQTANIANVRNSASTVQSCTGSTFDDMIITWGVTPSNATTVTETSGTANDGIISCGASATITASGGGTYLWSNAATTASITVAPAMTTTYTCTITSTCGVVIASRVITVNPFSVAPITVSENAGTPNDGNICIGNAATLTASGGSTYLWSTNAGSATTASITVSPTITSTYTCTVTAGAGCSAVVQRTINVNTVKPITDILLTENSGGINDSIVCIGDMVTLTATGGTIFSWNTIPAATNATITPNVNATTTYKVTVSDNSGCSSVDSIVIKALPAGAALVCKPFSAILMDTVINITANDVLVNPLPGVTYTFSKAQFKCTDIGVNSVTVRLSIPTCNSVCNTTVTVLDGPGCNPTVNNQAPKKPTIADPCLCQGTPTNLKDGQFRDKVSVLNAFTGEKWVVKSVSGLYILPANTPITNQVTPNTLIPQGTLLTEVIKGGGRSDFELSGYHIDSLGYTIEVWRLNSAGVGIPGSELNISNRCFYPTPIYSPQLPTVMPPSSAPVTLRVVDINALSNTGATVTHTGGIWVSGNIFTPPAAPGVYTISSKIDYGNPSATRTGQDITQPVCASTINTKITVQNMVLPALNCRANVNFTLDKLCTVSTLASDFLVGAPTGFGGYQVTVMNGVAVVPQISASDVGKTYTVKVSDLSNPQNSCWSSMKIEDKTAPIIDCISNRIFYCEDSIKLNLNAAPIPANAKNNGAFSMPRVTECSNYTLTFYDLGNYGTCNDAFIFAGTRYYIATDASGNTTVCQVPFEIRRRYLADIVPPANITISCSTVKGTVVDTSLSGQPTILGKKLNQFKNCRISATYTDVTTPNSCGIGFTVTREWVMTSDCETTPRKYTQIINVKDITAPQIVSLTPDVSIFVQTSSIDCTANGIPLPQPIVRDNCDGNPTVAIQILKGSNVHSNGSIIRNLEPGIYYVKYTVTDICGNSSFTTRTLVVEDKISPVAICRTNVEASLARTDENVINATSFDAGSWDNCCFDVDRYEVKRMSEPDASFGPKLNIRCADKDVMVVLRVWDCNGNANTCMTNLKVYDKLPPIAVPENITVTCGKDALAKDWLNSHPLKKLNYIPVTAEPGYFDHVTSDNTCTVTADVIQQIDSLDQCGNGFYSYIWKITDQAGNSTKVEQRYTSSNVSSYEVTFPKDTTIILNNNCDAVAGIDPSITGQAKINILGNSCPVTTLDYYDQASKLSSDSICFTVTRVWRVSNLCRPMTGSATLVGHLKSKDVTVTADATNNGFFEYRQRISIIDLTPPQVLSIPKPIIEPVDKECKSRVTLNELDVKDCSGQRTKQTIVVSKANGQIIALPTNDLPNSFEVKASDFGVYKVTYLVADECGNTTSTSQTFTVKDALKPTPICHDNVAIELGTLGTAMMQATAVDAGSFDNCTTKDKLKIRIRVLTDSTIIKNDNVQVNPDTLPSMYTFVCPPKQIPSGFATNWAVQLWVGDEAGNWDYCNTIVNVQDNMKACNYDPNEMRPLEVGLQSIKGNGIANALVKLEGTKTMNGYSNTSGKVTFNDLLVAGNYNVTPELNDNPLNGVSTYDLVLMSKHILGVQPFTYPYQYVAADVNKTNSITIADVVELRKMILVLQNGFTKNKSWRFVDATYTFPTNNPLVNAIPESISIANVARQPNVNFLGIKVGDINNSNVNTPSNGRLNNTVYFNTEDRNYQADEVFTTTFTAQEALDGYQFTFDYDKNNLELVDIIGEKDGFGIVENGTITASQILTNNTAENTKFSIVFRAKKAGNLSEAIQINSRLLNAEAYDLNGKINGTAINYTNKVETKFELFQNQPNPFSGNTTIGFNLPVSGNIELVLTDISGRVIKTISGEYNKGYNQINISKSDLGTNGVVYYTLKTASQNATKKMIIVE